jgi:hypothetical protein
MNRSIRSSTRGRVMAYLALAPLALFTALPGSASAAGFHFLPEGLPALHTQLRRHEVHALTFHPAPAPGHIHVSMNNHGHFTVIYAASEQPQLIALAQANGARYQVIVAKPKAATKAVHHKLRYIAGGILVLVIVAVLLVLLMGRRRALLQGTEGSSGEGADEPPSVSPPASG